MPFQDRRDAGRQLGRRMAPLAGRDVVVLGLPRGGVPVAAEVARALGAPLDVVLVRKLGLPRRPELAMGAVGEDGVVVLNDDVLEAARVVRALDLVVTVDSMPAHLAGALGVPVWTLLHADADWRWMKERDDSPWYPTMRLFRQQRPGAWADVIAQVASQLETFATALRASSGQA